MLTDTVFVDGKHQGIEADGQHLGFPSGPEGRHRNAHEIVQAAEETDLVKGQNHEARDHEAQHHAPAHEIAKLFVEQDDAKRVEVENCRSPHHQPAHFLQEIDVCRMTGRQLQRLVKLQYPGNGDSQEITEKQTIDRLADGRRILLQVEHEDHHQLAGKEDRRTRRDAPERQGNIEDRSEIGLHEMHDAKRRQEDAQSEALAKMQETDHQHEIADGFEDEERGVQELHHGPPPTTGPRERATAAAADLLVSRPESSNTCGALQNLQAPPSP